MSTPVTYRFSFGPWNISEGGDPFGGDVRPAFPHEEKFALYRPLGFEGVQFHDDDVVPGMDGLKPDQILRKAGEVKAMLANQGLTPEFVAPRLWFAEQTVDGAYTANSAYGAREDNVKGSLRPGLLADIVVLNQDLFTIAPIDIHKTTVDITLFNGRVIHQR